MRRLVVALLALAALSAPMVSWAQPGSLIIDTARPDRAPATAEPQPASPSGSGRVETTSSSFVPFVLREVHVEGSTLSPGAVGSASRPYIGQTVDAATLVKIADAIGAVYAKSEVALYTVLLPSQTFEGGVLRVVVLEGHISDVQITSDSKRRLRRTRAYAEKLKAERPLRRSTLQRYINLMRDIPGATVDVQLLPGASPGAVKLAVNVKRRSWQGGFSINNRGSSYLGRTQIEASATLSGALREGDQTKLTVAFPTEVKRFQYVSLAHSQPVGSEGATVSVNMGRLHTKPNVSGLSLSGDATTAGLSVSYPAIRSDRQNLFLTAGLDGLNSDNALFGQVYSSERTRALRLAASYNRLAPKQAVWVSATVSQGLDGLGARMADPLVDAAFTKVNAQAGLNRQVTPGVAVRLAASAQYSGKRLPASEQFTFGGAQFGRAFASAIAVGDSGYAGSIEVGWRPAKGLPKVATGTEFYAFADAGRLWLRGSPTIGPSRDFDLASGGGGVRLAVGGKAVIELEAAKALNSPIGGKPWRLMLSGRSTF